MRRAEAASGSLTVEATPSSTRHNTLSNAVQLLASLEREVTLRDFPP